MGETLKRNPKVWNVHSVLNVLHSLVDKSNINKQLEVYNNQGNPDSVAGDFGRHSLYKMLGYFSLVGLLRLHSLLGDFYQAIKVLENIELNKKSLYSRVPGCQITTYYYVGFAYMMMRRYADAIRTFTNILLYVQRTKTMFQTKSYQNDQINKQTDQMFVLLAICLVLHPQRIDESLHTTLREKNYADKINKMKNVVWTKGTSGLEGDFQSGSEVDFYIDKNMIHIADTKVARRYGDFFIRQIHKFDELNRGLRKINL